MSVMCGCMYLCVFLLHLSTSFIFVTRVIVWRTHKTFKVIEKNTKVLINVINVTLL